MPELPDDLEKIVNYHRLAGGALALLAIHDLVSELLILDLDKFYKPNSSEYQAAADALEGLKEVIAVQQRLLAESANKFRK